jgi:hypothetical protein
MGLLQSASDPFVSLGTHFECAMERSLKGVVMGYELVASSKNIGGDRLVIDELAPAMVDHPLMQGHVRDGKSEVGECPGYIRADERPPQTKLSNYALIPGYADAPIRKCRCADAPIYQYA